jgi:hypothetical protein
MKVGSPVKNGRTRDEKKFRDRLESDEDCDTICDPQLRNRQRLQDKEERSNETIQEVHGLSKTARSNTPN